MNLKHQLKYKLNRYPFMQKVIQYVYTCLWHRERLQRKVSYGTKNQEKIVYLIRPNSQDGVQGLMSLYVQILRNIDYAYQQGFVPVVDLKNYNTQYYDGINNVWDFYFKQPSDLTLKDAYESICVIESGITMQWRDDEKLYKDTIFWNSQLCNRSHRIVKMVPISEEVENIVRVESNNLGIDNCVGVYVRGTDYIELKPVGEHVQPSIDMVIHQMREFVNRDASTKFFLVTEDIKIYRALSNTFPSKVFIVSFDMFIENYDGKTFLSKSGILNTNKKVRGMDYLVKIVLLSRCKSLIASITMGSIAAYAMNGGEYEEKVIFDLGVYE